MDNLQSIAASLVPQNRSILVLDALALVAATSLGVSLYRKRSRNPAGLPHPPGPKPSVIPFIGNIPDMPSSEGLEMPCYLVFVLSLSFRVVQVH
jgi:hypothetical protein